MNTFLKMIVALSVTVIMLLQPATAAVSNSKDFCIDMGGMALIIGQYRDKGTPYLETTFALQNYLDANPNFPATQMEKDYALYVVKRVFELKKLSGDALASHIYNQCMAGVTT